MATTTNFGWTTPDDTDLVKDGAAAIRTLGSAIDTSLVDLKGGTTGQVLAKASNTDLDFTWSSVDPLTILDAKADLITATATDTPARLAVGANGTVLTADSAEATGLKWATPSAGSLTKISSTSFSNVATQDIDSVFSSTYDTYVVALKVSAATAANQLHLQYRYSTSTLASNYYGCIENYSYIGTENYVGTDNGTYTIISKTCGTSTTPSSSVFNVYLPLGGGNSGRMQIYGNFFESHNGEGGQFQYDATSAQIFTGFRLKSSSSNITGTVVVYGLEK